MKSLLIKTESNYLVEQFKKTMDETPTEHQHKIKKAEVILINDTYLINCPYCNESDANVLYKDGIVQTTCGEFLELETGYIREWNTNLLRPMIPELIAVDSDADESTMYSNIYECPCGHKWSMLWDCGCNDKCSECGNTISPSESEDVNDCYAVHNQTTGKVDYTPKELVEVDYDTTSERWHIFTKGGSVFFGDDDEGFATESDALACVEEEDFLKLIVSDNKVVNHVDELLANGYILVHEYDQWTDDLELTYTTFVYVNFETKDTEVVSGQSD